MATNSDDNADRLSKQLDKLEDKLSDRFTRIDEKFDRIDDRLGSIDTTLAAQHESLKAHMARTTLLENRVEPLETHVKERSGMVKLVKLLSILAALVETCHLLKLF